MGAPHQPYHRMGHDSTSEQERTIGANDHQANGAAPSTGEGDGMTCHPSTVGSANSYFITIPL